MAATIDNHLTSVVPAWKEILHVLKCRSCVLAGVRQETRYGHKPSRERTTGHHAFLISSAATRCVVVGLSTGGYGECTACGWQLVVVCRQSNFSRQPPYVIHGCWAGGMLTTGLEVLVGCHCSYPRRNAHTHCTGRAGSGWLCTCAGLAVRLLGFVLFNSKHKFQSRHVYQPIIPALPVQ